MFIRAHILKQGPENFKSDTELISSTLKGLIIWIGAGSVGQPGPKLW